MVAGQRSKEAWCISATLVGAPLLQSNFNHHFDRRAAVLGLPQIRVHDLRHTCATLLLSKDVHPKVVQALLGQGQINLALDTYSPFSRR